MQKSKKFTINAQTILAAKKKARVLGEEDSKAYYRIASILNDSKEYITELDDTDNLGEEYLQGLVVANIRMRLLETLVDTLKEACDKWRENEINNRIMTFIEDELEEIRKQSKEQEGML